MQESIIPKGRVFALYGENRADDIMLFEDAGSIIPRHHGRGECCKAFWDSLPTLQPAILRRSAKLMDPFNFIRDVDNLISAYPCDHLYDLVARARHLEATDARDKIFGLLGVALHAAEQKTSTEAGRTTVSSGQENKSTDQQQSSSARGGPAVEAAVGTDPTAVANINMRSDMLGIVPDYKQTTVEVYTRLALRLMARQGSPRLPCRQRECPSRP